jgi:hypothetical protein
VVEFSQDLYIYHTRLAGGVSCIWRNNLRLIAMLAFLAQLTAIQAANIHSFLAPRKNVSLGFQKYDNNE